MKKTLSIVLVLGLAVSPLRGQDGGVNAQIKTEHLTVTLSQSQSTARPGDRVSLILDVTLPPKMRIYGPGVKGYLTTAFNLDANAAVTLHAAQFPKPTLKLLPAIHKRVPVFEERVRIVRDVTIGLTPAKQVDLVGMFEYQACDDQICYVPKKVPVSFSIAIKPLDR